MKLIAFLVLLLVSTIIVIPMLILIIDLVSWGRDSVIYKMYNDIS